MQPETKPLMVSLPLGTYDSDESLNVGSNQWKARLSAPLVQSLGPWVPGERTTLELVPSLTLFGDNDDALGNAIEQDPLFGLEAHLTRDLTRETFLSLDYTLLDGGDQEVRDSGGALVQSTAGLDAHLLGVTVGYEVNDNMRLFFSHSQALSNDSGSFELDGSLTMITLSWSWHAVLEKSRHFREG